VPLVTEARDWTEGVYMAATMGSETTAAAAGAQGVVRRDPFAMLPFMGYHMGDHFGHWLHLGRRLQGLGAKLPAVYCVNWFRKGPDGRFVWPGYGENMRVLEWMLRRIDGQAGGVEHAFGVSPRFEDLRWEGLGFDPAAFDSVMHMEPAAWAAELASHDALFAQLADRLPAQLPATRQAIGARLGLAQPA
jgi:phosphoenolpyruvate carboxykinase (GTP)